MDHHHAAAAAAAYSIGFAGLSGVFPSMKPAAQFPNAPTYNAYEGCAAANNGSGAYHPTNYSANNGNNYNNFNSFSRYKSQGGYHP